MRQDAAVQLPALDGLRAVAIGLVFWHHLPYLFDRSLHETSWFWRGSHGGSIGVDLFFVLSGYLITSILRTGPGLGIRSPAESQAAPGTTFSNLPVKHLKNFWIRRALRLLPLFYFYMFVVWILTIAWPVIDVQGRFPAGLVGWLPFLFYLGNLEIVRLGWFAGELNILWSLAVEEQFYLFWPLLATRLDRRSLLQLCLTGLLLSPLLRLLAIWLFDLRAAYVLPFCRLDALLGGAALAGLLESRWQAQAILRTCQRTTLPAVFCLLFILFGPLQLVEPGGAGPLWVLLRPTAIALLMVPLVGSAVAGGRLSLTLLASPPLRFLGRISYGLYLWQWLVGDVILLLRSGLKLEGLPVEGVGLAWVGATVGTAWLSYHFLEAPFLKLKSRFSDPR